MSMGQTQIRCWWWSNQSLDPKNTDPLLVLKLILGSAGAQTNPTTQISNPIRPNMVNILKLSVNQKKKEKREKMLATSKSKTAGNGKGISGAITKKLWIQNSRREVISGQFTLYQFWDFSSPHQKMYESSRRASTCKCKQDQLISIEQNLQHPKHHFAAQTELKSRFILVANKRKLGISVAVSEL